MIGHFRVGTGWKMNHTRQMARDYAETVKAAERPDGIELFVLPPFTALAEVATILAGTGLRKGDSRGTAWS